MTNNISSFIFLLLFFLLQVLYTVNKKIERIKKLRNKKSQFNQDLALYYYFYQNIQNGFFIEIGAYDGIYLSNSYFFEKNFNWKGILIEGGEDNCINLRKNAFYRSSSIIICSPICKYNNISYINNGYLGSITYTNKTNSYRKCNTLSNITKFYKVNHVDLFSLDVEGYELEVLETFDFNVDVSNWIIEWNNLRKDVKKKINALLNRNGYAMNKDIYISPIDVVFSKKKLQPFANY